MLALDSESIRNLIQRARSPLWLFYLWVPVGIGLFMGSIQPGRSASWPLSHSFGFWLLMCCIDWWLVDAGCRLASRLLRPFGAGLLAIVLAGSVVTSLFVVQPVNLLIIGLWSELLPAGVARMPLPDALSVHLEQLFPSLTPWFLANFLFYRVVGLPRYGFSPRSQPDSKAVSAHEAQALPVFLAKVRADRRGQLLAINAQGHYLRVITTLGEDLVLHNFGDAIGELDADSGLRVHRSWWVARRALDDCQLVSTKLLRHIGGLEIPVSRTFREQLRQILDGPHHRAVRA